MTPTTRDTQEQEVPDEFRWKIDRHIPLAVIFTIVMQTGVAVWWLSDLSTRLDQETERNARQDSQIEAVEAAAASQQVGMATTVAELRAMQNSLGELKEAQAETNSLLRELLTNGKGKP